VQFLIDKNKCVLYDILCYMVGNGCLKNAISNGIGEKDESEIFVDRFGCFICWGYVS